MLAGLLARLATGLPDTAMPDGAHGRFHVELVVSVEDGHATHVKSAAYFERSDNLEGRP